MENFVAELEAVLSYYKIEKAILLAHSFGACVAIDFALAHPQSVTKIILSSPLLSTPRWIEDANALLDELPEKERGIIRRKLAGESVDDEDYKRAERALYNRHLCRLDPWPERMLLNFSKSNGDIYRMMWGLSEFTCTGTLKDYDRFDDLSLLLMPALLTCGRYDEAKPDTVLAAASRINNAQTKIFEKSAHAPVYEETEIYIETMRSFCAQ